MSDLFVEQNITDTLRDNYMPYAMSVIVSRAIPEIDGFKPSHRKLLYTMYKMGLLNGPRTKSANVVGQTMKLNPHGDMAIYETMVRLTRGNGALLHPFVDSKGNFGRVYSRDMAFAASRYTEVRLDPICEELFSEIDKNTVEFTDNYDGTLKEPLLLPTTYPNILVNPNQGIAVGMASNLASFNLREVCEATAAFLKDENVDLTGYLLAPDFSTGGELLYNEQELRGIYETGRGQVRVRARYRYDKKENRIEIYEIPYSTSTEVIMEKIIDLIRQNKVREISDVRDETDLKGLKITIDLKKGQNGDQLMARLFRMTPLCDVFSCNFNVLVDGRPRVMGVRELLREWTRFRLECLRRQLLFDVEKKGERLHLLYGLREILLDIDRAIAIIRGTEKESDVIPNLMAGFSIDRVQAEYICEIRLRNLNKEYILKRTAEIEGLEAEIARLRDILSSGSKMRREIARKLSEVSKQYGAERRTQIVYEEDAPALPEVQVVDDYALKLFFTSENYLKKISLVSLRSSGEQRLKEGDFIKTIVETQNRADLLLFSDRCACYKMKIHEIPDTKASNLGEFLPNLLGMEEGERILDIVATTDYSGFLLFAYENGKIAKVKLSGFATKTNRKKLMNAYSDASPLIAVVPMREEGDVVLFSSIQKVLAVNTASISEKQSRSSQGVSVMTLRRKSTLEQLVPAEQARLANLNYYRARNIPAAGCFLKEDDREEKQLDLFGDAAPGAEL